MIRLATHEDLPQILEIFATARNFMKENGNPTQWGENNPPKEMLLKDLEKTQLYVYFDNEIHGVFVLQLGDDPIYQNIEGEWHSNSEYVAVHRVASSGKVKGVFDICMDYIKQRFNHIRIDTHEDNATMQYLINKHGFKKCGIVYMPDNSPRIAFDYISN